MRSNGFAKVSPIDGTTKLDDKTLHVYTKHALIQSIGYLKYILAHDYNLGMAMRGQRKLYGSLTPSLFHKIKHKQAMINQRKELIQFLFDVHKEYIDLCKNNKSYHAKTLYNYLSIGQNGLEPLLQHYGIPTTWLDLVDNIWVALWFACHKAQQFCNQGFNYSLYEKRNIYREAVDAKLQYENEKKSIRDQISKIYENIVSLTEGKDLSDPHTRNNKLKKQLQELNLLQKKLSQLSINSSFCYIILVGIPLNSEINGPDYKNETVLDLRSYYPSLYLRPHAQHGLLFRKAYCLLDDDWNYSDYIEGIIRIDLTNALEWLGVSETLSPSMLFPSPVKDIGLQKMLRLNTLRSKIEIVTT